MSMGAGPAIAVVDYGMGNRRSVQKALEHVGARAQITHDHSALGAADGIVLPGVGAFPQAMRNLNELGLQERSSAARRCSESAWACSCCSTVLRSWGRPPAWA